MKACLPLICAAALVAGSAFAMPQMRHLGPQDLYPRETRVLAFQDRPERFRVLVTPNLMPRAAAMVAAVGAGKRYCAQYAKDQVYLRRVERHSDRDLSAWAMEFSCR